MKNLQGSRRKLPSGNGAAALGAACFLALAATPIAGSAHESAHAVLRGGHGDHARAFFPRDHGGLWRGPGPALRVDWHGGHGRWRWHGGRWGWWWVNAGVWTWYAYNPYYPGYPYYSPYYVYPGPYYYPPEQAAPSFNNLPAPQQFWYYCDAGNGYYPNVPTCPGGWRAVPAAPAQAPPGSAPQ